MAGRTCLGSMSKKNATNERSAVSKAEQRGRIKVGDESYWEYQRDERMVCGYDKSEMWCVRHSER